jgi:hypothetical protein
MFRGNILIGHSVVEIIGCAGSPTRANGSHRTFQRCSGVQIERPGVQADHAGPGLFKSAQLSAQRKMVMTFIRDGCCVFGVHGIVVRWAVRLGSTVGASLADPDPVDLLTERDTKRSVLRKGTRVHLCFCDLVPISVVCSRKYGGIMDAIDVITANPTQYADLRAFALKAIRTSESWEVDTVSDAIKALSPPDPRAWVVCDGVRGSGKGVWFHFRDPSDGSMHVDQVDFGADDTIVVKYCCGLSFCTECQPCQFDPELAEAVATYEDRPYRYN